MSHLYAVTTKWTGNTGKGTSDYRSYERSHTIVIENKADILCSSDPNFRGDETKHNPEELLLASLTGCHMLQYLHLCAISGIVVTGYTDRATGVMIETSDGGGYFTEVILNPIVTITREGSVEQALYLHAKAGKLCFIANSVNFPVKHKPVIILANF